MANSRIVVIPADHPALPGHFPGHPVVPGVVILAEVMEAIRETVKDNIECVGLPTAKFLSPLRPGEHLCIRLDPQGPHGIVFTCTVGSRPVAAGCLVYRIVPSAIHGIL